jgi:tetratricopeptide (TPR) repeat protein
LDRGAEYFRQAIALDPTYALPYTGVAHYYIWASDSPLAPREAIPKAKEAAERSLALDDSLAEAHAYLAFVHALYEWDQIAAEREFKRAIEVRDNCAIAHAMYGYFLTAVGRDDEAIAHGRRGAELDPLSPEVNTLLGVSLYYARRYDEAIAQLQPVFDLDPGYWFGRAFFGIANLMRGRTHDAIRDLEAAQQRAQLVGSAANWMLGWAYAVAGRRDSAVEILEDMIRQRGAGSEFIPPYGVATIYAGLGDRDRALDWLEKAYEDRSLYLPLLGVDPAVDGLRSEPRFTALTAKIGYWDHRLGTPAAKLQAH